MTDILEQQIIELQAKVAFQEDAIQALSDVVSEQNAVLMQLETRVAHWQSKLDEWVKALPENTDIAIHEKPPHY